ncbi:hypothetical protein D3C74_471090 [compost metagenome]
MLHHRCIGREKHTFQAVLPVQPFGEGQNTVVRVRRGPYNHLGALTGWSEAGGVVIFDEIRSVLVNLFLNQGHGLQNRVLALVGSQPSEAFF